MQARAVTGQFVISHRKESPAIPAPTLVATWLKAAARSVVSNVQHLGQMLVKRQLDVPRRAGDWRALSQAAPTA